MKLWVPYDFQQFHDEDVLFAQAGLGMTLLLQTEDEFEYINQRDVEDMHRRGHNLPKYRQFLRANAHKVQVGTFGEIDIPEHLIKRLGPTPDVFFRLKGTLGGTLEITTNPEGAVPGRKPVCVLRPPSPLMAWVRRWLP